MPAIDEEVSSDVIRFRISVNRDMGVLFDRLAGSTRASQEAVHLMRLGAVYEQQVLSGKLVNPTQSLGPSVGEPVGRKPAAQPVKAAQTAIGEPKPGKSESALDLSHLSGVGMSFFQPVTT